MKRTLGVLALLLSALAVLSFGAISVCAEGESGISGEESVPGAEPAGELSVSELTTSPSQDGASQDEASQDGASQDGVSQDEASQDEASDEESQDGAAAVSDKGGGFPLGVVIFCGVVVLAVIVCLVCVKLNNRFGRWLRGFFRDYKSELKKVTWPSREVTLKSTAVVLVCLVVSGAAVGLLDFGLAKLMELFKYLVEK